MKDRDSYYRYYKRIDHTVLIELLLPGAQHIYNPFDPSPYPERLLDNAVEDYIVEAVRDFSPDKPMELVIYLPKEEQDTELAKVLEETIHNHFRYRTNQLRKEMGDTFRAGRVGLVIGISFLALTLLASYMIAKNPDTVINEIVRNSLLIIGWVAMWQPISIFFYAWQPFRQKLKVYQKICSLKISILFSGDPDFFSDSYINHGYKEASTAGD
jgi:hypothetical protein